MAILIRVERLMMNSYRKSIPSLQVGEGARRAGEGERSELLQATFRTAGIPPSPLPLSRWERGLTVITIQQSAQPAQEGTFADLSAAALGRRHPDAPGKTGEGQ